MKSVEYVVRSDAGAVERGVVADGAAVTSIGAQSGQEISLNLRQVDMRGYQRDGENLIIELVDGRIVVVENYFNSTGDANRLFISADGYLNEVAFVQTGDGAIFGQYGPTEQWGKWSPSDDLIFLGRTELAGTATDDQDVSMLAAGLLGGPGLLGAGAAGAVALGGLAGGGGGSGGDDTVAPFVNNAGVSQNIGGDSDVPHQIVVTGGGAAGEAVTVTIGDETVDTVIGDDGTFEAVFTGDDFPADGPHDADVVFGGDTTLDGPSYVIDTVAPEITITSGTQSVNDAFNANAFAAGVTLTGTGEAGAALDITIDGVTRSTTVGNDGQWSLTWENGTLPSGEYSSEINIVTRDDFGNSRSYSDVLVVDTVNDVTINTSTVEGDGVVNAAEHSDGVDITGTAQAGASVVVTMGAASHTVTATNDGTWSATFAAADIPTGEYQATVTAVATDPLGNVATASGNVTIDTGVNPFTLTSTPGGADAVINAEEAAGGLVLTGQVEPGSAVSVMFGAASQAASVAADGVWTASFAASDIPAGEYTSTMTATATDAAGNTSTLTQNVAVDTVANTLSIAHPIETDDVINEVEASDGVVLSGASVPGATVQVTIEGVTHSTVANGSGAWQVSFAAGEIAPGTYTANITATSTDAAGNTNTITDSVQVDTVIDNLSVFANPIEGDDVINEVERADGVIVSGTVEIGSTVQVTLGGAAAQAVVQADGTWAAEFAAAQIPQGEYDAQVTVVATDPAGNVANLVDDVRVDTLVNELSFDAGSTSATIEGDGTINAVEAQDGINLGGQVEPGSAVVVSFNGTPVAATVDGAGNWSVEIPASAIPGGSYEADIVVNATDIHGNTDSISQTVTVDTDAPDGPVIAAFTRDTDGLRSISTEGDNDGISIAEVNASGAVVDVASQDTYIGAFDETLHAFENNVPDGSDLIVTNSDAAGNQNATYLALDDETPGSTVGLGAPALGSYQIETVDLQFAEAATLTLTDAEIVGLSDTSDTLTVHGGTDDTVQITGAVRTGGTTVQGQSYDVYTTGDATLIVDSDISIEEPPVI